MTYLERLKKSKTTTVGTVLTAKSPFDSKDSGDSSRFQKMHSIEKSVEVTAPHLPPWCRVDCLGVETIALPNEGEVIGCVHPATGAWRRLDLLTECPALEKKTTRPILPECVAAMTKCLLAEMKDENL